MRIRDLNGLDNQISTAQVFVVDNRLLLILLSTDARFFRPNERRRANEASKSHGPTLPMMPILRLELLNVHVKFSLELALLLQLFVLRGALWRPEQEVIILLRLGLPAAALRGAIIISTAGAFRDDFPHNRSMLPFVHCARSDCGWQGAPLCQTHHFLFGLFRRELRRLIQLVSHSRLSVLGFLGGF